MGGAQWDVSLPPMGSAEEVETYERAALLLGQQPHALLLLSAAPHALLAAQRAGWRTAYVPRPGALRHPRSVRAAEAGTLAESKPAVTPGPRAVGKSTADYLHAHRPGVEAASTGSPSSPNSPTEREDDYWDGELFDVCAPDLMSLATQLVPPHTSRWRP